MRIAVISDIHGNATALRAVLADTARRAVDQYVVLGDLVVKGPEPAAVVEQVRELGASVVRGNCEEVLRWFPIAGWRPRSLAAAVNGRNILFTQERLADEQQRYLLGLPDRLALETEGHLLEFYHAAPDSLDRVIWPWDPDAVLAGLSARGGAAVVYGHIHQAFVRTVRGRLVANSGSAGMPFDGDPRAGYLLLEAGAEGIACQVVRVDYDVEAAVAAARRAGMPDVEVWAGSIRRGRYPFSDDNQRPLAPPAAD